MSDIKLYQGDCLELMKDIPDKSIDMILCDPPFGTTACAWDSVIPFDLLWGYNRIIKDNGCIALFCCGSFTHKLIMSNESMYRYKWVWVKNRITNFVNAKNRPMTSYEEICIFSKGTTANGSLNKMRYYPQGLKPSTLVRNHYAETTFKNIVGKRPSHNDVLNSEFTNYPKDVIRIDVEYNVGAFHPTQKPVELLEYLIKTYTNEGDTVLDNCMGSGSTGIACLNTNRNFIGMELDENYFHIAEERIKQAQINPEVPYKKPSNDEIKHKRLF